jgi:hypothetical protein
LFAGRIPVRFEINILPDEAMTQIRRRCCYGAYLDREVTLTAMLLPAKKRDA